MPASPEFEPPVRMHSINRGDYTREALKSRGRGQRYVADYLSPVNEAAERAAAASGKALSRLVGFAGGEVLGAGLGYLLDPDSTTFGQHVSATSDFVAGGLGLAERDKMPQYSLSPAREQAVRDVEGMVGFRPGPGVLRARQGDAAYPSWGAEAITAEERRLYLAKRDRLGLKPPEWAERTADVKPRREKPRTWELEPEAAPKRSGRAWDTFWEEEYPAEPGRDAVLKRQDPLSEDWADVEGWGRVLF